MNDQARPILTAAVSSNANVGNGVLVRVFLREHGFPALIGLFTVVAITGIMMAFSDFFVRDHLIFFYLFPISGIAMYYSSTPAVMTSVISSIGAAYLLFPPIYSLRINEPLQIVELFFFSVFAFIASKASNQLLR